MHYTVWVEPAGGGSRIVLTETADGGAASALVATMVSAAAGVSFGCGVTITMGTPPTPAAPVHATSSPASPTPRR